MSNTLQDQLLKAGLANKKQAVRAKKAKNNKEKLKRQGREPVDQNLQQLRETEAARVERDRRLNRERHEVANQKATIAQIRELIALNRIQDTGDTQFHFVYNGVVKTLYTTSENRNLIGKGRLGVVKSNLEQSFDLVPSDIAKKIRQRDANWFICLHDPQEPDDSDDEYGDFKVPDDLVW